MILWSLRSFRCSNMKTRYTKRTVLSFSIPATFALLWIVISLSPILSRRASFSEIEERAKRVDTHEYAHPFLATFKVFDEIGYVEYDGKEIGLSDIQNLSQYDEIEVLHFSRCTFTPDAIAAIPGLPSPFGLILSDSEISPELFTSICSLEGIVEIEFLSCSMETVSFENLSTLKELESLSFAYSVISDTALHESIKELTNLHALSFRGVNSIDDWEIPHEAIARLRFLDMSNTNLDDQGCKVMARCHNLQTLILQGTPISDEGIRYLPSRVNELNLSRTQVSPEGLKQLGCRNYLCSITVSGSESDFSFLWDFPNIESVSISPPLTTPEIPYQ